MKALDPTQRSLMDSYLTKISVQKPVSELSKTAEPQEYRSESQGSISRSQDRVELSNSSRTLQKIHETPVVTEPERAQRIEEIRARIQEGRYEVDPEKIAVGMMLDLLKNLG